jgi:homoaconitase/3-isopropylmalate dehydratase large subunit
MLLNMVSHTGVGHAQNGIVHVVGPENGITLPGATIVCGDCIPQLMVHSVLLPGIGTLKSKWF